MSFSRTLNSFLLISFLDVLYKLIGPSKFSIELTWKKYSPVLSLASNISPGKPENFQNPQSTDISGVNHTVHRLPA